MVPVLPATGRRNGGSSSPSLPGSRTALLKSGSIAEHGLYSLVMLLEGPNSENRDLVTAVGRAHLKTSGEIGYGDCRRIRLSTFLEGCVGFEELDGDQAMDGLARCLELTQQLAPLTEELSECLRFAKGESDHLNLSSRTDVII